MDGALGREVHENEDWQRLGAVDRNFFPYKTIVVAANNFHPENKLGTTLESVYKGKLENGREIAVKKLPKKSEKGTREFIRKGKLLSNLKHPNLVKLLGYAAAPDSEPLLVYEYVSSTTLEKRLLLSEVFREQINWTERYKIIEGTAKGLKYLHDGSQNCIIIHGNIKPSNILLDDTWRPIIAGFSQSHQLDEDKIHVYMQAVGTREYIAPEFSMYGYLSKAADIYSFGVLVLELISGKRCRIHEKIDNATNLLDWAHKLYEENRLQKFIDPTLAYSTMIEQVTNCTILGLLCIQGNPKTRPSMDHVLSMLTANQGIMKMQIGKPGRLGCNKSDLLDSNAKLQQPRLLQDAYQEKQNFDGAYEVVHENQIQGNPSNSTQIMEEEAISHTSQATTQNQDDEYKVVDEHKIQDSLSNSHQVVKEEDDHYQYPSYHEVDPLKLLDRWSQKLLSAHQKKQCQVEGHQCTTADKAVASREEKQVQSHVHEEVVDQHQTKGIPSKSNQIMKEQANSQTTQNQGDEYEEVVDENQIQGNPSNLYQSMKEEAHSQTTQNQGDEYEDVVDENQIQGNPSNSCQIMNEEAHSHTSQNQGSQFEVVDENEIQATQNQCDKYEEVVDEHQIQGSPSISSQIMKEEPHSHKIPHNMLVYELQVQQNPSNPNHTRKEDQDLHEEHEDEILKKKIAAQNCQIFSYQSLDDATNKFASQNKVGQGGFGAVYKGKLNDGREIAVKKSLQSLRPEISEKQRKSLIREVELLSSVKHPNVVKLYGYYFDGSECLLVYEYVTNKSLDKLLFGPNGRDQQLDWTRTYGIIKGIANGLSHLHADPKNRIIHRDIKPGNILLDRQWVAKVADFGISRLIDVDRTHISTALDGTLGYLAPEYLEFGRLSTMSDVYSFGVLMLEIVSGKRFNFEPPHPQENAIGLLNWAYKLWMTGKNLEIMDPALANSAIPEQVKKCIKIGLLCVQGNPELRPDMKLVVSMLTMNQVPRKKSIGRPGIFGFREYKPHNPLNTFKRWWTRQGK